MKKRKKKIKKKAVKESERNECIDFFVYNC